MKNKTHWKVAGVGALAFGMASLALSGQGFAAPPHPNQPTASPSPAAQAMQKLTQSQIQSVQDALKKAGYQVKVDGIWGNDTSSAVKKFQTKNGLPATGYADQATRQALGLGF